ncbi:MAG: hypothetical protein RLZZ15_2551 [Verrucomicrobiota bacterium]|jgi:oligopeptide transport system substrate-binding protein
MPPHVTLISSSPPNGVRSAWPRIFLCGFLSLIAALQSACAKREPASTAVASRPQILRVSQRAEPADLDPARATIPDEFFIIRALSEGLLIPDPAGGAPLPGAAERFDVSADGLTYTFRLRPDAKWSNGEPVIAADFVESYRRLLTPATAAPKAHLFYAVKNARAFVTGALADFSVVGFAASDAHTLVVTLAAPLPRFPFYVASGPWIPVNPRVVARHGRKWTLPENFVGNGPFSLAEWRPHQRIVVKKNPAFRTAATVRLAEIQFIHLDTADSEERAFRAGQVDVTMDVPKTKLEVYARERPAELHRVALAETRYLAFNSRRPPLDDARVRQALALAVDRPRLVERVLLGGQTPAANFLPPSLVVVPALAAVPSRDARDSRDPPSPGYGVARGTPASGGPTVADAQRLLAAAGFPGGKNFPRFEITAWSSSQVATLETIQAMWRQNLGVEISIALREAKVHLAALAAGDYDIGFINTLLDVPDAAALLADFTTGAPANYPHWSDPAYDALLGELAAAPDTAARAALERRAEDFLLRAAPVAPLYFNTHNWLQSPRVRGWQEDALWARSYLHVYLDEK